MKINPTLRNSGKVILKNPPPPPSLPQLLQQFWNEMWEFNVLNINMPPIPSLTTVIQSVLNGFCIYSKIHVCQRANKMDTLFAKFSDALRYFYVNNILFRLICRFIWNKVSINLQNHSRTLASANINDSIVIISVLYWNNEK